MYQDTGLIFAGDVFMGAVDASGNLTAGMFGPINVPSFELTPPTVDTKTRTSRQRATYGQALDTVNVPNDPAQVEITFDSLPAAMLAEALGGTSDTHSVTGSSVTSEAHTLVEGKWIDLAQSHLTASSVIVTDTATSTALTEGTDYEVNLTAGMVKALTTTAAVAVTVDYDYESIEGHVVKGGNELNKPRRLKLVGKNLATGEGATVEVDFALMSASDAMDLMSDDFVTGKLTGTLKTLSTAGEPFRIYTA